MKSTIVKFKIKRETMRQQSQRQNNYCKILFLKNLNWKIQEEAL